MTKQEARNIIVDTSAAAAVVFGEDGSAALVADLERSTGRLMSAGTRVELGIVVEARLWPAGQDIVERFVRDADITVVPVDERQTARALGAWRRYGKGRHHAGLNFGDCFTYALAEETGHPILCTGDDFAATDIEVIRPLG